MRRGLEGGAKRDPVHDSSAVAAGVSGWPGVGRTATTEAASGRRAPTLDGQPTSDVPAVQAPGGGWRGAGTAGASGEDDCQAATWPRGVLLAGGWASRRRSGRERSTGRSLYMHGTSDVPPGANRAGGLGAVSPKGGASGSEGA